MSEFLMTGIGQIRTPFYGATTDLLEIEIPKSPLLKELLGRKFLSPIPESTSLQRESWVAETQHSMFGTGWWSTQGDHLPSRRPPIFPAGNVAPEQAPSEKAASDRVTLLARKYVGKESFSDEEKARLAIVTERIRNLMPAVTVSEIESLDAAMQQIKLIAESDKHIRDVLGIKR